MQQSKEDVIRLLGLIPHADHGFFRETYRSGATPMTSRGQTDLSGDVYPAESIQGPLGDFWKGKGKGAGSVGVPRNIMTSILFMVTSEKPYIFLHANEADCMHYWQGGGRLEYVTVSPAGELKRTVLGPNLAEGDSMQFLCPGGEAYMKGCRILDGADYVLLGEAVAPGFDVAGHHYVTTDELKAAVTDEIFKELSGLLRAQDDPTFDSFYD